MNMVSHMAKEKRELVPLALGILGERGWPEIDAQIAAREDPPFGPKAEARYRKLHDRIVGRDA